MLRCAIRERQSRFLADSPVMMDPLKLRDMRIPMSMSPAIPSQVLTFCILLSKQEKLMEAGGSSTFATPSTKPHTLSGSSITYTEACTDSTPSHDAHASASDDLTFMKQLTPHSSQ